jgi:hypothetical protein
LKKPFDKLKIEKKLKTTKLEKSCNFFEKRMKKNFFKLQKTFQKLQKPIF